MCPAIVVLDCISMIAMSMISAFWMDEDQHGYRGIIGEHLVSVTQIGSGFHPVQLLLKSRLDYRSK